MTRHKTQKTKTSSVAKENAPPSRKLTSTKKTTGKADKTDKANGAKGLSESFSLELYVLIFTFALVLSANGKSNRKAMLVYILSIETGAIGGTNRDGKDAEIARLQGMLIASYSLAVSDLYVTAENANLRQVSLATTDTGPKIHRPPGKFIKLCPAMRLSNNRPLYMAIRVCVLYIFISGPLTDIFISALLSDTSTELA
jgi:hypothetical protein